MASSSRYRSFAAAVAVTILVSACSKSDPRLTKLSAGMPTDSVLVVMGTPANRVDRFLVNSQNIEAMYFTLPGESADSGATADRSMTPAIIVNGRLVGWGWKQWDSIAAANKVQVAPETK